MELSQGDQEDIPKVEEVLLCPRNLRQRRGEWDHLLALRGDIQEEEEPDDGGQVLVENWHW